MLTSSSKVGLGLTVDSVDKACFIVGFCSRH